VIDHVSDREVADQRLEAYLRQPLPGYGLEAASTDTPPPRVPLSYRLRGRAFAPLAESFFHALSSNRAFVSEMLTPHDCEDGACHAPR